LITQQEDYPTLSNLLETITKLSKKKKAQTLGQKENVNNKYKQTDGDKNEEHLLHSKKKSMLIKEEEIAIALLVRYGVGLR